jgi:DNA-binding MarR family transcriptional regulator
MSQLTLFDGVRPDTPRVARARAVRGPQPTSREAAERLDRRTVSRQAGDVLRTLRGRGEDGATAAEIAADLELEQGIVTARLGELYRLGLAAKTDRKRVNQRSGMRAVVVVARSG